MENERRGPIRLLNGFIPVHAAGFHENAPARLKTQNPTRFAGRRSRPRDIRWSKIGLYRQISAREWKKATFATP
ncbi:MAG: hypothetical protein GY859_11370 [Desulfobacterales bacterium]|nr:hypothetical protein [Desulfobacterales bacterium]